MRYREASGSRRLESTNTDDWNEAQRRLRERLHARDNRYKELVSMKKDEVDLDNAMVWIPDSKTPNGVAEVPLTPLAVQAFQDQLRIAGPGIYLFPSDKNQSGHQTTRLA